MTNNGSYNLMGVPQPISWDGKTLSAFIKRQYGIDLGVRQCQRLFRQLGFRLRKPRPLIAKADPELQEAHKKNFSK
jgi:transposase